ncbi:TolC family protein, partial [Acinetobacter baumannii]
FVSGAAVPTRRWTLFGSEHLNALVDEAFRNSPSIGVAQATLRQSQEQYNAVRAGLFPTIDGSMSTQRQKVSGASYDGPPNIFTLYD